MPHDPEGQGGVVDLLEGFNLDDPPETAPAASEPPSVPTELGEEVAEGSPALPESPAPEAPASPEAPAIPVVDPNVFTPPDGGTPFTFRVDGQEVAPEGARVLGDYILMPKAVWNDQIRPKYLGNRNEWRERERAYQRELSTAQSGQSEESQRARSLIGVVDSLFADPEKLLAAAQNWQVEGPKLRAEAEANLYKSQLTRYKEQEEQARTQEDERKLLPVMDNHLAQTVEGLLAEAGVQWQGNQAEEARWKQFVQALEEDIGFANLFTRDHRGQLQVDEDKVRRVFTRELNRTKGQTQATKVVEKKAALNAAAVAPAKPMVPTPGKPAAKAPPAPPRNRQGQFVPADEPFDANEFLSGTKFLDDS